MKPTPTPINEQAIDKAAREGYAVRCKTNGPRVLDQYASPDIMRKQLDDARVIVSAYLDALSVPAEAVVGEPVAKIKNDPDNYLTVGKVQSKIADERNRSPTSAAAWAFRDNGDDPWSFARDEPEICYEKRPLYDHPSIQGVVDADWWLVATDMGKVIFHGPDKDRADRVAAIHGREAQPLYAAPSAPDGWQPIETAPKDGTNIQVWAEGFEWPEVVRYELYDPEDAEEIGEPGYWRYSEEMLADVANVEDEAATHWRPLPAPPALGGASHE